jgi:hypothetical protein
MALARTPRRGLLLTERGSSHYPGKEGLASGNAGFFFATDPRSSGIAAEQVPP